MSDSEEIMNYSKAVTFTNSETEDQCKTNVVEVSGRTENFLQQDYNTKCGTNTHFPRCQPLTPQLDNSITNHSLASEREQFKISRMFCAYLESCT